MDYRQLGDSGLRFSELILGTMGFGGGGQFSGVGQIDLDGRQAADRHGARRRRQRDRHGRHLHGRAPRRRSSARRWRGAATVLLVATKARFAMGRGPNDAGLSRHHLIRACEASLRRLRTDHIDLYQLHEWDGQTPLEETLGALEHLLQSGKVRYVGCSNFAGWQVTKALGIAARERLPRFVSQQVYLSLQERSAEYEIVPSAIDQGLGLLIWSPLAGGLLSGKYRRGQAAAGGRAPRQRMERAAGLRRGQALRHDRGARRDRRGSRRVRRTGRARLAAGAPRRHQPGRRRADRRAARRQPRGGVARARRPRSARASSRSAARR